MNVLQILEAIAKALDPLMILVYACCWAIGVFLYISALMQAKRRAELGPGQPGGWGAPISSVLAGTIFLAMPTFIKIMNVSIFNEVSVSADQIFVLAPSTIGKIVPQSTRDMIQAIVAIIQFLGVIAVMRGIYLLRQSGQGGQSAPTFGPGVTFLIAGVIAGMFPRFLGVIESLVA